MRRGRRGCGAVTRRRDIGRRVVSASTDDIFVAGPLVDAGVCTRYVGVAIAHRFVAAKEREHHERRRNGP
jgi:hypothetical protein